MNVTDNQAEYVEQVYRELVDAGVRVRKDLRNEKLGFKIREAQLEKTPYMLIIGDREMESRTVAPRFRDGSNLDAMSVEQFITFIRDECKQYH